MSEYLPSAPPKFNRAYGTNGLNQLTTSGATALGYDGRGNLTSSGSSSFSYTSENRLAMTNGGSALLTYDPTGRLMQVAAGGGNYGSSLLNALNCYPPIPLAK